MPIGSLRDREGLRVDCRNAVLTEPVAGRWDELADGAPIGSLCDRGMVRGCVVEDDEVCGGASGIDEDAPTVLLIGSGPF